MEQIVLVVGGMDIVVVGKADIVVVVVGDIGSRRVVGFRRVVVTYQFRFFFFGNAVINEL